MSKSKVTAWDQCLLKVVGFLIELNQHVRQVWPLLYKKKTVAYGVALYAFLSIVELYIAVPQQKSAQTGRTKWDKFTRQGLFFK